MTNPRTLEDVILWPNEDETVTQFKCTKCNCVNAMFKDHSNHAKVMEKGWGLTKHWDNCINALCGCHTGSHPLPRILAREATLEQAFGVMNSIPNLKEGKSP